MTESNETKDRPDQDPTETDEKPLGLVARLKQLYEDRQTVFAVGVIGVSALVFLLGGILSGDVDFSRVYSMPAGTLP
ncbi:hypothetical protein [Saccharopolyspora hattusasensis]|uniref:hypothetical protein n=1 Tax=Saccharopolyspora hattusasensis TaxID=1128679 RepID=UPI003D962ED0